jgi:hypothetical protein
MRIAITGLIVIAMMLAMIPSAMAYAVDTAGQIEYEDSTPCPAGWTVCEDNLNHTYDPDTWCESTFGDGGYMIFDYLVTGEANSNDDYIWVNVTSPDGKWYGEKIVKLSDAWDPVWSHYVVDIVVHEVPVETENFTKPLPLGWNLISLPLTPTDNSTSAVLGNATIAYDAVKQYNATSKQFEDATTMDPGVGYFVHVTTAGTWEYEGTAYTSISASLSQGLNMVGWTNTSADLPGALSSIDSNYRYVAHWNATSQSYEVYEPNAPAVFNDFATMERGEGYFIAATSSCTLAYP